MNKNRSRGTSAEPNLQTGLFPDYLCSLHSSNWHHLNNLFSQHMLPPPTHRPFISQLICLPSLETYSISLSYVYPIIMEYFCLFCPKNASCHLQNNYRYFPLLTHHFLGIYIFDTNDIKKAIIKMTLIWPKGTKVKRRVEIDGQLTYISKTIRYTLHDTLLNF